MKKVIDMRNMSEGDVIRYIDHTNDNLIQTSVISEVVKRGDTVTVITEMGSEEIGIDVILSHYEEVVK